MLERKRGRGEKGKRGGESERRMAVTKLSSGRNERVKFPGNSWIRDLDSIGISLSRMACPNRNGRQA